MFGVKKKKDIKLVLNLLEQSSIGGNKFAMYNLGIANLNGYYGSKDLKLANEWFIASDIPEGFYQSSIYYKVVEKNLDKSEFMLQRALNLGLNMPWRTACRKHCGSGGGTSGFDFNMDW